MNWLQLSRNKGRRALGYGVLAVSVLATATVLAVMPAQAAVTQTLLAGAGGSDQTLLNDIPATTANMWGPNDVAVSNDGTLYIADTFHHQIRTVGSDGIIRAFLGTGTASCPPTATNGLVQPRGLTFDDAGNLYVANTLCNFVEKVTPAGVVSIVAGQTNPNAFYTPNITDGMPATAVFLNQPAGLDYDDASGTLYIADQYSSRILKVVNGGISVAAGDPNAYNGYTGDGVPATQTRLNYPNDVLFKNGELYITDSSNCRVRKVDTAGIITTIAGQPSCYDSGDGGPATAAAIGGPNSLAFDAQSNLYISSGSSGTIRKIDSSGIISTVTEFYAGAGGIVFDGQGDLIVANSSPGKVYKVTGLAPVLKPIVLYAKQADPQRSDPMLTRGVYLFPLDNGITIDRYEYAWSNNPAATAPSTALQTSSGLTGRLDFRDTTPNTDWYLFARAVSTGNVVGDWSPATKIHTPFAPVLVVGGDSIAAGHHLELNEATTRCEDESYGYAAAYATAWKASIPHTNGWQSGDTYKNYAYSGFSVVPHTGSTSGSMTNGGKDACGAPAPAVPLTSITTMLSAHKNSWNQFIGTFGIDDTNWVKVLGGAVGATAPFGKYPLIQELTCSALVRLTWNGYSAAMKTSITNGIRQVMAAIQTADPLVNIDVQGYYNVAGTGIIPVTCTSILNDVMNTMHATIRASLPESAQFNDVSSVMNGRADRMQPLFANRVTTNFVQLTGWPHPNQAGGAAIAGRIH